MRGKEEGGRKVKREIRGTVISSGSCGVGVCGSVGGERVRAAARAGATCNLRVQDKVNNVLQAAAVVASLSRASGASVLLPAQAWSLWLLRHVLTTTTDRVSRACSVDSLAANSLLIRTGSTSNPYPRTPTCSCSSDLLMVIPIIQLM